jgi:eukaryotic-like serine/threonine-protein kinase
MAPEMVAGGPLDARADAYLLGATLHELLTGEPRHRGATLHEVLAGAYRSEPFVYDDSVPRALAELCNRATHADPNQRPASAQAFREDLARFLRHRGSIAIAEEALRCLGELQALLDEAGDMPPPDLRGAYELATQSRFGSSLALRDWAENPKALEGLRAAIEASVELELRQGHVGAAEALLEELPDPPPELRRRLEALARQRDADRAEHERLQQLERELDVRVSGRERLRAFAIVAAVGVGISAWVASRDDAAEVDARVLLQFAFVLLGASAAVVVAARRSLFRNALNRRLTVALLLVFTTLVVSRTVGLALEMPTSRLLIQDALLLSALMALGAITLLRRLWMISVLYLAGMLIIVVRPALAIDVFGLVAVLSVPLLLFALSRHMRDRDRRNAQSGS